MDKPETRTPATLSHLRELTAKLTSELQSRKLEMAVECGRMTKYGLLKNDEVAIATFAAEAGTVVQDHVHTNEKEWMGVHEGEMLVTLPNDEVFVVNRHNVVEIKPGVAHRLEFKTVTRGWAVTMPADKGFPDGYTTDST